MYVVVFSIHLHKLCFKVFAYPCKVQTQSFDGLAIKDIVSILCYKDQMHMH